MFKTVNDALVAADSEFSAMSDENIRQLSYGIERFEFSPYNAAPFNRPTPEMRRRLAEMRNRLNEMKRPRQRPREQPETLCDCGHYTAHPMNASQGTSCPDCYDRMSN